MLSLFEEIMKDHVQIDICDICMEEYQQKLLQTNPDWFYYPFVNKNLPVLKTDKRVEILRGFERQKCFWFYDKVSQDLDSSVISLCKLHLSKVWEKMS